MVNRQQQNRFWGTNQHPNYTLLYYIFPPNIHTNTHARSLQCPYRPGFFKMAFKHQPWHLNDAKVYQGHIDIRARGIYILKPQRTIAMPADLSIYQYKMEVLIEVLIILRFDTVSTGKQTSTFWTIVVSSTAGSSGPRTASLRSCGCYRQTCICRKTVATILTSHLTFSSKCKSICNVLFPFRSKKIIISKRRPQYKEETEVKGKVQHIHAMKAYRGRQKR